MVKKLSNLLILSFISIAIMIVYTLVHEGAHALFVVIFGGKVSAVNFNILSGYPSISFEGNMEPYENAIISMAGPLVPYLLLIAGLAFINKNLHLFIQKIFSLGSLAVLASMIPNIIIPILQEAGSDVAGEDMAKFVMYTGFNGYVVALIMAMLFVAAIILVRKKLRFKDAFAYSVDINLHNKKRLIVVIVLTLSSVGVLIAAAANLIGQSINANYANIPKEYDALIEIDLKKFGKAQSEIHEFTVEEPALYDFVVVGNTTGEIQLELVGSTRINGLRTNEMVLCAGIGKMNAHYTNWRLESGHYKIYFTKASGEGQVEIYVSSKIVGDMMLGLAEQDEAIMNGDIPQQELKLAAKEELSDYSNKIIYEFTLDRDKNVFFTIFLTTRAGEATVYLEGENYEEELISEYQIKTEERGSFLKKGKYRVIVSCSGCEGEIYLFSKE